ncbi:MAG: exodeoxyribonuclease VII small subunit [Bacteroidetes bacterium]|jgi:exodeoxyribonuclease VII small subunit|nr:exodeoxyribonuclease VII small subunit [Bacteroidota bacterium]
MDEPDLSFDAALQRLEARVATLEEGDVTLEEALEAYAEGIDAANACLTRLRTAELRIESIQLDASASS